MSYTSKERKQLKIIKMELIKEYGNICFLGGSLAINNPLTVHHVDKHSIYGKLANSCENARLFCYLEHQMYHTIDSNSKKSISVINDGLNEFIRTKDLRVSGQINDYMLDIIKKMEYYICEDRKLLFLKKM